MEGSTSLTEQLGDARALEVMRAHDTIVRDALHRHDGTEVDHAGDGIMASFLSVVEAVRCAIAIERGIAGHNESAEVTFKVRIGITAGEPVTESDRIFGAAIQLAARICGCAEGGQVLTSNVIRELCIGKGFAFLDRGTVPLKGFDAPVNIFEVAWQPS